MTNSAAHYRSGGLQPRCVLLICKIEAMPDSGLRDGIIRGGTRRITSTRQHRFQQRDLRKEPVLRILRVIVVLVLSELVVAAQTALSAPPGTWGAASPSAQAILAAP